jgi:hypothetical protein
MMTHKFDGFYRIFQSGIGVPGFLWVLQRF